MSVPVSVFLELGKFAFDQYQRFREQGRVEMTDEEWLEFEAGIKSRRQDAWDRLDKAKNP